MREDGYISNQCLSELKSNVLITCLSPEKKNIYGKTFICIKKTCLSVAAWALLVLSLICVLGDF